MFIEVDSSRFDSKNGGFESSRFEKSLGKGEGRKWQCDGGMSKIPEWWDDLDERRASLRASHPLLQGPINDEIASAAVPQCFLPR